MGTLQRNKIWLLLFVGYFSLLTVPPAHAYLDPGSGSFLLQILAGAALGAGFAIKVFWRKIVSFFTRKPADPVDRNE